jgi:hypothetical protein
VAENGGDKKSDSPTGLRWQLLPAVFGLVGAVVGSGLTAGATYLGNQNGRKANERGATRLVAIEMRSDEIAFANVLMLHRTRFIRNVKENEWRQQQPTLARYLNKKEWTAVSEFYSDLEIARSQKAPPGSRCLPSGARPFFENVLQDGMSAEPILVGETPDGIVKYARFNAPVGPYC